MTKPDHAWRRGSGFGDTADGGDKVRHRTDLSDRPTPGDISAALYGPTIRDRTGEIIEPEPPVRVAPFTARPALPPALAHRARIYWQELRRLRQMDRETVEAIRDAAADELRRRDGR